MAVNLLSQFGIKDASNASIIRKSDKKPVAYLDYCNSLSLEVSSDTVVANAKGQKAIVWNTPSEGTLSLTSSIANFAHLALQFGAEAPTTGAGEVFKKENLVVTGGSVTLAETPRVGTLGVARLLEDGSVGEAFTVVDATPAKGEVKLEGSKVSFFAGDVAAGEKVVVMYITEKASGVLTFSVPATAISENYEIYMDVLCKYRHSGVEDFVQCQIFSATPSAGGTLTLDSENASNFDLTFDIVIDPTKVDAKGRTKLFDLVAIEE